ncbi:MAG: hypothetical protein Q9165_001032 [Trypethelium subeluteriae]
MALATLYQEFAAREQKDELRCTAFVLDHGARKGSTEEARQVAKYLISRGLDTKLLTLGWPQNVVPSELPDFETQARRLRYQVLADACCRHSIRALLFAHHRDDQAETVLSRLTNGYDGNGLRGMVPVSDVPYCEGMYGAYRSGQPTRMELRYGGSKASTNGPFVPMNGIEKGGLKICRPLLSFSKDQLIATCKEKGVKWFEDETNQDRTLTVRNAVRYLIQKDVLPSALRTESLLAVAAKAKDRVQTRDGRADDRFEETEFRLDIRAGRLIIHRLPNLGVYFDAKGRPIRAEVIDAHKRSCRQIAIRLLRRYVSLVSPLDSVPLKDLERPLDLMFPELADEESDLLGQKSWTVAGVMGSKVWDRGESEDSAPQWVLRRQPLSLTQSKTSMLKPPLVPPHNPAEGETRQMKRSKFVLWDGRYWIRLMGQGLDRYEIRPFTLRDRDAYLRRLSRSHQERLAQALQSYLKETVLLTLPAIVKVLGSEDGQETSEVVALPTLGSRLPKEKIRWECRYKQINLGKRQLEVLDPPFVRISSHNPALRKNEGTEASSATIRPNSEGSDS